MRRAIGSMLGLSICLTVASAEERPVSPQERGPNLMAAGCPTRFDYEVLASAADSGNLLSVSAYRFRRDTSYSSVRLTGLQRVSSQSTECGPRRPTALQERG